MSVSEAMLLALAFVVTLVLVRWIQRTQRDLVVETASLPKELQEGELIYAEKLFRARWPVQIVPKIDRGYRDMRGWILLLELKTRRASRPYLSAVIELSVQRLAVAVQTQEPVAAYGYVLIQQPGSGRTSLHQVHLLTHDQVITLVKRRDSILTGSEAARYAHSLAFCEKCAFRQQCDPPTAGGEKREGRILFKSNRTLCGLSDPRSPQLHSAGSIIPIARCSVVKQKWKAAGGRRSVSLRDCSSTRPARSKIAHVAQPQHWQKYSVKYSENRKSRNSGALCEE